MKIERKDICIVSGCKNKTLNYTGIIMSNSEHMLKMHKLMAEDKHHYIELFNNCEIHWLMLMNDDGV